MAIFAGLALVVVVTHVAAAGWVWRFYDAGSHIFVAQEGPDVGGPTPDPSATSPTSGYVASPAATPETRESRINFLLTGIDSSETRTHALTDTLMVVSVDPETGKVAMVSFPRDIARFPLSNGKTFVGKINGLMTYANNHKKEFPDGGAADARQGARLPARDPDPLLRVRGPRRLLEDDRPGRWGHDRQPAGHRRSLLRRLDRRSAVGFHLTKGKHKLDGETALAYVRSRKGVGDSDFSRARRQQQLLVALEQKLTDPACSRSCRTSSTTPRTRW